VCVCVCVCVCEVAQYYTFWTISPHLEDLHNIKGSRPTLFCMPQIHRGKLKLWICWWLSFILIFPSLCFSFSFSVSQCFENTPWKLLHYLRSQYHVAGYNNAKNKEALMSCIHKPTYKYTRETESKTLWQTSVYVKINTVSPETMAHTNTKNLRPIAACQFSQCLN
jgi:hypothetical protein